MTRRKTPVGTESQPALRPPPLVQGMGKEAMQRINPLLTVDLDAGVFDWLWRIVESKHEHAQHYYKATAPEYTDLVERAVEQFRAAMGEKIQHAESIGSGPPQRVIKRSTNSGRIIRKRG